MRRELEPVLSKGKYVDYYGVGQIDENDGVLTLLDCGYPTAQIVNGKFKLLVLHPEDLEWLLIREFAYQNGFPEFEHITPATARRRYGVYPTAA